MVCQDQEKDTTERRANQQKPKRNNRFGCKY